MMSITTKGRYAARMMVLLARQGGDACLTKHDIAENESISANYVEQIMLRLKTAHIVRSFRGRKGGFALARSPEKITLSDVLRAVEGPVSTVPCLAAGSCSREFTCPTRPVWKKITGAVERIFASTTIAEMAKHAATDGTNKSFYQI